MINMEAKDIFTVTPNFFQEKIDLLAKQLANERDEQLLEVLRKNGHEFESKYDPELHKFIKERCHLNYYEDEQRYEMLIDSKVVAEWSDKIAVNIEGNTVKATVG